MKKFLNIIINFLKRNYIVRASLSMLLLIPFSSNTRNLTLIILTFFFFYCTIKIFSYNRCLFLFIVFPFHLLCTFTTIFAYKYSMYIRDFIIAVANPSNIIHYSSSFITLSNFFLFLFTIIFSVFIFWPEWRGTTDFTTARKNFKPLFYLFLFFVPLIITHPLTYSKGYFLTVGKRRLSVDIPISIYVGFKYAYFPLDNPHPPKEYPLTFHNGSSIVVLHMGESSRSDHWEINGYKRHTNPFLMKENIINFATIYACGNQTAISIPCILNGNSNNATFDDFKKGANLINILAKANINYSVANASIDPLIKKFLTKKNIVQDIILDEKTFNLDKAIKQIGAHIKNQRVKSSSFFLFLRNHGNHGRYADRAPSPFNLTALSPIGSNTKKIDVNGYDRAIIYTDFLIEQEIKTLKALHQPVFFLYTSDHGESLGENGFAYHSNSSIENRMVPLFVWVSNEFKTLYPQKYHALLRNAKKYQNQLSHEVIWHTLLDAFNFSNKNPQKPFLHYERSLLSDKLKPQVPKDWFVGPYKRY
jgi:glucan phosphoethanolaminetransferase (alkaline phosphatase superfamily)